jgi:hypothetical protein
MRSAKLFVIPIAFLFGCGDKKSVPFLGTWTGDFEVTKVLSGTDTEKDRIRHNLKGYVRIVLDNNKYTMVLEGEQQAVDIKGTWVYKGKQVILSPIDVDVKNRFKGEDLNPNLKAVDPADLYSAYLKKITLNLSTDGKSLRGLDTTVAALEGRHNFKKE